MASRQRRIACWAVAKHTTFLYHFRPRCAMDCSAHPTAREQGFVRRVDNIASTLSVVMSAQMARRVMGLVHRSWPEICRRYCYATHRPEKYLRVEAAIQR